MRRIFRGTTQITANTAVPRRLNAANAHHGNSRGEIHRSAPLRPFSVQPLSVKGNADDYCVPVIAFDIQYPTILARFHPLGKGEIQQKRRYFPVFNSFARRISRNLRIFIAPSHVCLIIAWHQQRVNRLDVTKKPESSDSGEAPPRGFEPLFQP